MPEAASVLIGPGGDRVDADVLAAEIDREIAHACLERCLGHAHDVVVRHDLFSAVVGERQQRAAIRHQDFGALGDVGEREDRNIHGLLEIGAGRIDIAAVEFFLVGEGDGVNDEVDLAPQLGDLGEDGVERRGIGDIAMADDVGFSSCASGSTRFLKASP